MAIIDDKTREQLDGVFEQLSKPVELLVFTAGRIVIPGKDEPGQQEETLALLREVAELSDKLTVLERPLAGDEEARALGVDRAPTTLIREAGSKRGNIRFLGLPAGYEFATLIEAIRMIGSGDSGLAETTKTTLAQVQDPVNIQSFVTPTCPYCPQAVLTSYRFAYLNDNITAEGIEANEFPKLAERYRISGVPDTIITGSLTERVLGGQPERVFVEALLKAAGVQTQASA